MFRIPRPLKFALPLTLIVLPAQVVAQAGGEGVNESLMWPAPIAEDWDNPVLITFQRTWEDAVTVSQETGRPILICVNMDGEPASEHYAGIRYREPEIAALYDPYVCVIASVYRHTPRDYGDDGQPILCPRLGSVTCGEHIAIEPYLYERFFEGRRISPRHIMVELDGEEVYDVSLTWDTDSVFETLRGGIASRPAPAPIARGDRTIFERVESRDVGDRDAVERAYAEGDPALRRALLEAAAEHIDAAPVGLLRLAIFGFDPELGQLAREALAKTDSESATGLISEALRVPMEESDREDLVDALERIGRTSSQAKSLSVVHRGLAARSSEVNIGEWSSALVGAEYPAPTEFQALESSLDTVEAESRARGDDAQAQLELAEASLRFAMDPSTAEVLSANRRSADAYSALQYEDARRAALRAEELGATGWRLDAALAITAYYLSDRDEAYLRAEAAMGVMPSGLTDRTSAMVLRIFAESRQHAIAVAVREKVDWPQEWLTDVYSAYTVLGRHPLGEDAQVVTHYDFLKALGAGGKATEVLDEGLRRFPNSFLLHDRLRTQVLEERGLEFLESTYEDMLEGLGTGGNLQWYAGYTSIVAAEFHRRAGDDTEALAAYGRAIAYYQGAIESNPLAKDSSDHYIAISRAGRARIAYNNGDYDTAVAELLASLNLKPEAAGTLDGLGFSAVTTAQVMVAGLGREELILQVQAALDQLDPDLLLPPAFESEVAPGARRGGRGRRGGGRGRGGRRGRRGGE